ncbi:MAG: hypothetical protein JOZ28_02575 [Candidatus Eremiobacteraeota bacterium]|nr:hypothetical protein [Candidatus Eremiobacteraeota bacterium]
MIEDAPHFLASWSNFYVMTGSSAAALVGLMFVVITLVTRMETVQMETSQRMDGVATYSTPTVTHFGAALFISAVLEAPWHLLIDAAFLIGLCGLFGVVYVARVIVRTRRLTAYSPDPEDWLWYTIVPLVAYGAVFIGAVLLPVMPVRALFTIAGAVVLLIFTGIRNAWDVVTYLAVVGPNRQG